MKKILGLVFSNRRLGNSEILVKEIMRSIPDDGSRELIRVTDLQIEPCKACYRCLQTDTDCVIKDDFNFLMDKIKAADALIMGVPIYFLGPHGCYKMLSDRMLGAEKYWQFTGNKHCVIVMPYGSKGWEGYSKAASVTIPKLLKMKLVDCWQVHATLPGESLLNEDNLHYAQALGHELFSGRKYNPGNRECAFCGSDLFRLLEDNRIVCPICGAQGIIGDNNIPDFMGNDYCRFSEKELDEHFQEWLLEMKQRFLQEKDQLKAIQAGYRDKDWWIKPGE